VSSADCEERVKQSVVLIVPIRADGSFLGSSGTGVIVDQNGTIYTNRHVVAEGSTFLIYLIENPNRPPILRYMAVSLGYSSISYADFAILQITQTAEWVPDPNDSSRSMVVNNAILPGTLSLPFVSPSGSAQVRQGDGVRVFGFPGWSGQGVSLPTLVRTQGQIIGIREYDFGDQALPAFYFTDAGISPGNSGGLAINDNCEYIGIPTATITAIDPETGNPVGSDAGIIYPIGTLLTLVTQGGLVSQPLAAPAPPATPTPAVPATPLAHAKVAITVSITGDWNTDRQVYVLDTRTGQRKQLTSCGLNANASWSPDGSKLVYVSLCENDDQEIWIMNEDGSGQTQLTRTTVWEDFPFWSPDGTKIVYTIWNQTSNATDLWIMNADGSGQQELTTANTPGFETFPAWSPDGQWIAFTAKIDNGYKLCFVAANGTGTRNCPIDQGTVDPNNAEEQIWWRGASSWTADSQSVVYRVIQPGVMSGIFIAPITGTNPQMLNSDPPGWNSYPFLSADGGTLFVTSVRNGEARIHRMRPDGSAAELVSAGPGNEWNPDFYEVR
jgi:hypothetical protein